MRKQLESGIAKLALPRSNHGQYNHDDITTFIVAGCHRVLKTTFNTSDTGNRMDALLRSSMDTTNPSVLLAIKLTDAATIKSVIEDARPKAAAASTTEVQVAPTITTGLAYQMKPTAPIESTRW